MDDPDEYDMFELRQFEGLNMQGYNESGTTDWRSCETEIWNWRPFA